MANPTPLPEPVPSAKPPSNLKGYVTLQSIIYDVLNEMGVYDFAEYKRLMQFAIRGLIYLNMYDMNSLRVVYLTVNSAGITEEFPDDYIDWTKVGQIDSAGNVIHWLPNTDLYMDHAVADGTPINPYYNASVPALDSEALVGCVFAPHFIDGCFTTKLYGARGGRAPGYFRVDSEDRVIRCDRTPPGSKIVLEYNSTGISMDGATYIGRQAVEPMIAWVHWKRKKEDPNYTRGERIDAQQEFEKCEEALRAYEGAPTIQQLQDAIYESYTQSVRR